MSDHTADESPGPRPGYVFHSNGFPRRGEHRQLRDRRADRDAAVVLSEQPERRRLDPLKRRQRIVVDGPGKAGRRAYTSSSGKPADYPEVGDLPPGLACAKAPAITNMARTGVSSGSAHYFHSHDCSASGRVVEEPK